MVGPNVEECFMEDVKRGEKVLGSFNVAKGGSLDINIKVYNPDNTIVYEQERQIEGSFSFVAVQQGIFKFCFGNTMSTVTSKAVSFNIYAGLSLTSHGVAKSEHFTPLENSVLVLSEGLNSVHNEQKYITTRERLSGAALESTYSRVMWVHLFEALVVSVMAGWEVFYLKRLFEKKRAAGGARDAHS